MFLGVPCRVIPLGRGGVSVSYSGAAPVWARRPTHRCAGRRPGQCFCVSCAVEKLLRWRAVSGGVGEACRAPGAAPVRARRPIHRCVRDTRCDSCDTHSAWGDTQPPSHPATHPATHQATHPPIHPPARPHAHLRYLADVASIHCHFAALVLFLSSGSSLAGSGSACGAS